MKLLFRIYFSFLKLAQKFTEYPIVLGYRILYILRFFCIYKDLAQERVSYKILRTHCFKVSIRLENQLLFSSGKESYY